MEYNIIFQRIFNDIPFIGYYSLEDIPYSGVICNIISYFCLRSAYSPRRSRIQWICCKMARYRFDTGIHGIPRIHVIQAGYR